jgi:hypothetical protein
MQMSAYPDFKTNISQFFAPGTTRVSNFAFGARIYLLFPRLH